ncbi:glycosyl hydrolase family 18 protein [Clostridium sp. LP20]|uniref:glycosyl hydrolase family 18 protein n=1 Tax=Clostridium sp. LP20 TaxID=3418665 RepID=UPI003EE626EE
MKKRGRKISIAIALSISVLISVTMISKAVISNETYSEGITANTGKQVVTNFYNWSYYPESKVDGFSTKDIAWNKITQVNHGFWEIGSDYKVKPTDEWADLKETKFGHGGGENLAGHFGEYKYYKKKYPNVKILISVGGWTRSNMFHETAGSEDGRKIFAQSLVDTLVKYPFIDGFDIDWQYPCVPREPVLMDSMKDFGNVAGNEDKENFTLLLKECRETLNNKDLKNKMLTVVVSGDEGKLQCTEPDKFQQYVDYISVMSTDFLGDSSETTKASEGIKRNPLDKRNFKLDLDGIISSLKDTYKVPAEKLLLTSSLDSSGLSSVEDGKNGDGIFKAGKKIFKDSKENGVLSEYGNKYLWWYIKNNLELENSGWKKYRDNFSKTPYMYNYYEKEFITYEDEYSLKAKCNYVSDEDLGGIAILNSGGDDFKNSNPMHTIMADAFIKGNYYNDVSYKVSNEEMEVYELADINRDKEIDLLDLSLVAYRYNISEGNYNFDKNCDLNVDGIIDIYDIVLVARKIDGGQQEDKVYTLYDDSKRYKKGDLVTYNGEPWICLWENVGNIPGESDWVPWERVNKN